MWPHILNRLQNRPLDHFYTLDSRPDVFQCSNDHQSIETVRPGSTSASWQWRRAEWNWDPIGSAERSSHRLWHWGHTCAAPWRSCKCQTSGGILPERWGVNSEIPQTVQEMGQFQSVSFGKVTNQPQLSGSFGGFISWFFRGKNNACDLKFGPQLNRIYIKSQSVAPPSLEVCKVSNFANEKNIFSSPSRNSWRPLSLNFKSKFDSYNNVWNVRLNYPKISCLRSELPPVWALPGSAFQIPGGVERWVMSYFWMAALQSWRTARVLNPKPWDPGLRLADPSPSPQLSAPLSAISSFWTPWLTSARGPELPGPRGPPSHGVPGNDLLALQLSARESCTPSWRLGLAQIAPWQPAQCTMVFPPGWMFAVRFWNSQGVRLKCFSWLCWSDGFGLGQ